jgi:hypothetical protein
VDGFGLHEQVPLSAIILKYVLMAAVATVVEFFILVPVLHLLRRTMDLSFPEPPRFYRRVLAIAALMGSLGLIPCVGGIVGLFVAAGLTRKFFDGSMLAGGYVALAMLAGHYALYYTVMVSLKAR